MQDILQDDYFPSTDVSSYEMITEKESLRPGVIMKVRGPIGITEKENRNGRVYTNQFWDDVLGRDDVQEAMKERALVGAADHPDKFVPPLSTVSHVLTKAWVEKKDNSLMGESEVLDTPMGRIVSTLLRAGVKLGASTRGGGNTTTKEGKNYVSEKGYKWGGFDFVFEPSAQNAYPKPVREQVEQIICESSPDAFKENPEYFKNILEKLGCNSGLILERIKPVEVNLNEISEIVKQEDTVDNSSGRLLDINLIESKKEIESLKKKIKSIEESLTDKENQLGNTNAQNDELSQKISVLLECIDSKEIPEEGIFDSVKNDMDNLESLYEVVKNENDSLVVYLQEATDLAKARKEKVIIETRIDTSGEKDLHVRLLHYGRLISSLTESRNLLAKENSFLHEKCVSLQDVRKKLISEKAVLYSRLNLVINEAENDLDESFEEETFEEIIKDEVSAEIKISARQKVFESTPSIQSFQLIKELTDFPKKGDSKSDTVFNILKKM